MKKRYGERLLKWETHKKTFNIHTSKQQLVCSVKVSVKIVFRYLCKQVTKIKTAVSHIITSRWSWLWISMGAGREVTDSGLLGTYFLGSGVRGKLLVDTKMAAQQNGVSLSITLRNKLRPSGRTGSAFNC